MKKIGLSILLLACVSVAQSQSTATDPWNTSTIYDDCLVACSALGEGVPISAMADLDACNGFLKGVASVEKWHAALPGSPPSSRCVQDILPASRASSMADDPLLHAACSFGKWTKARPSTYARPAVETMKLWMKSTGCEPN